MAGPFDFLDPSDPMAGQLMAYGQPDPIQDGDMIRFLGANQAQAVAPEFADLAMQSQEAPVPDDFWARVAQGSGPQPFGQVRLGHKPTGLEALLALAAGFANAKATQGARRVDETQQQNQRAREAAKTLANYRHATRLKDKEIAGRNEVLAANEAFRRDKLATDAAQRALERGDREEWRRILAGIYRDRINAGLEKAGLGGGGAAGGAAGAIDPASKDPIDIWARKLSTGEATIGNVPTPFRTGAVDRAGTILPPKARDTIKEVNAARAILTQLGELSGKIPRGKGAGRFKQGIKSSVAGFAQSEGLGEAVANYQAMADGMLANISRATGERGVLTNQDIDRVKKNIPTVLDTDTVARNKLKNIDDLFNEFQQRTLTTYTQPMGGLGAGAVAPVAAAPAISDDAAYQEYLKMVGSKK